MLPLCLFLCRLKSGSEHGSGQLGYLLAVADSGFNPFLDQPLLCVDKLCRAFHRRQRPHRGGQLIDILRRQFLIRLGQLLNGGSRSLPFSVRAAAVSPMAVSAASLLLDSTSALASANCSAACLAMAGNSSQIGSGTHFRRSR
jgi:hypothetical protein